MQSRLRNPLYLLALGTLALTACDDDLDPREETNDRLVGDWDVTSLTQDGVELIGAGITSFEMEFEKEDPFEGETEWTIICSDGSTQRLGGDYEIEDEGRGIEIEGDDYDVSVDGDELEISGAVNGVRWDIEADRD